MFSHSGKFLGKQRQERKTIWKDKHSSQTEKRAPCRPPPAALEAPLPFSESPTSQGRGLGGVSEAQVTTYGWGTRWRWPCRACWTPRTCSCRNDPLSCWSLWGLIWSSGSWCRCLDPWWSWKQEHIQPHSQGQFRRRRRVCHHKVSSLETCGALSPCSTRRFLLYIFFSAASRKKEKKKWRKNWPAGEPVAKQQQLGATWHVVHHIVAIAGSGGGLG